MRFLRLGLILSLVFGPCDSRTNAALSAVSLTLHLNATFRAFVEASGYRTDAENPEGNGPGRIGGHSWDAQRHRFDGWWPQYTWRYTGWTLTF